MKLNTLQNVLKLMRLKADRSVLAARQAQNRHLQAQAFAEQVRDYAGEYDKAMAQVAREGDSALLLQSRASFNSRLHSTAREQAEQVKPLQAKAHEAMQQALHDQSTVKAMEGFVDDRQRAQRSLQERRQDQEAQDLLQARIAGR